MNNSKYNSNNDVIVVITTREWCDNVANNNDNKNNNNDNDNDNDNNYYYKIIM